MAEDIKSLLEKIHQEGVKPAEEKAVQIEAQAREQAAKIIELAKKEAEGLLRGAKERIAQDEQSQKALLAQAGRDLILKLRGEINACLGKIIAVEIDKALSCEVLAKIIAETVKKEHPAHKGDVAITLSNEDVEVLQKGFLSRLKEELKKGVVLRASDDISGGFTISYDAGKSQFDFSDKALADYLGSFVKPKLKTLFE